VGSAAFNLLGITAVCVVAIPSPDVRKIKDIWVYVITASFSVFAYLWLVIILVLITPNIVEVWEGVFTFFMFPILVVLAFLADKGIIGGSKAVANSRGVLAAELAPEELASLIMEVKKEFGDKPDDEIMQIVERKTAARPSKAAYRYMSNKTIVSKKQAESASKLFHMGTRVGSMGELKAEAKKALRCYPVCISGPHNSRECGSFASASATI
jgi:solute carrier family 8 (sodium/calcium exchanger)